MLSTFELVLVVWLAEPVIRSVTKGFTYATLMFARGDYAQGFSVLTRIPSAILMLATWPYTATVGSVVGAIEMDKAIQKLYKGDKNVES